MFWCVYIRVCVCVCVCCVCVCVCLCVSVCLCLCMCMCTYVPASLHTHVVSVLMCSRCGLLLCGGLWCTYTTGALNVARAHAPHCDAESDFGLCPSPSLADCSLTPYTQDTYACTVLYVRVYKTYVDTCFN